MRGTKRETRRLAGGPLDRCAPGDLLWVRERLDYDHGAGVWRYAADGAEAYFESGSSLQAPAPDRWASGSCPSLFMPRALSRLTLIVEAIGRHDLQDLSAVSARAEGVRGVQLRDRAAGGMQTVYTAAALGQDDRGRSWLDAADTAPDPVAAFAALWDGLHRPGRRWADNPVVTAIRFRVVRGPVARAEAELAGDVVAMPDDSWSGGDG